MVFVVKGILAFANVTPYVPRVKLIINYMMQYCGNVVFCVECLYIYIVFYCPEPLINQAETPPHPHLKRKKKTITTTSPSWIQRVQDYILMRHFDKNTNKLTTTDLSPLQPIIWSQNKAGRVGLSALVSCSQCQRVRSDGGGWGRRGVVLLQATTGHRPLDAHYLALLFCECGTKKRKKKNQFAWTLSVHVERRSTTVKVQYLSQKQTFFENQPRKIFLSLFLRMNDDKGCSRLFGSPIDSLQKIIIHDFPQSVCLSVSL